MNPNSKKWCDRYNETGDIVCLNRAWDVYFSVYNRIEKQLPKMKEIDLEYSSPRLKYQARNLDLASLILIII